MVENENTLHTSYAQNFEDVILRAYFHDVEKGFYVDVGANHPVVDSVTNLFYEDGWRGINIEPLPEMFSELERLREKDINVQAAVSRKKGEITLHIYHTAGGYNGLSTASNEQERDIDGRNREDIQSKEDIKVAAVPLRDILAARLPKNKKIDFMKVDVEGLEDEVLRSNDWDKYSPEIICIEADHVFVDWKSFLQKKGYRLDFYDGINEYYVQRTSSRSLPPLYVDHILKKNYIKLGARTVLQAEYDLAADKLEKKIEALESRKNILENKIVFLDNNVNNINLELQKRESLKYLAKHVPFKVAQKLESKIEKIKAPVWDKPNLEEPGVSSLNDMLDVANQSDKVFRKKPSLTAHKKLLYTLFIVVFKVTKKISFYGYKIAKILYSKVRK